MNVQFKARDSKTAEIWLYDQIGASFWDDGISAKTFQKELTALGKVSTINLRINSPGGDVFDGLAIYNQLKQHPARIVVDIDGLAASIASIIAMSGDEIRMAGNAMMMIHNAHGMAVGDSGEMQRMAALLTQINANLADTYAARTAQTLAQLQTWMNDESWMTAEAAVQHGFADAIVAEQHVSARFGLLDNFRNVPATLRNQRPADHNPTRRDIAAVRIDQQARRLAALA
jgi:ATP-dependent Clp protease protease subunit